MDTESKKVWASVGGVPKPNPPKQCNSDDVDVYLNGKWYVYVPAAEGYLHNDGIIRENCSNDSQELTGWYHSKSGAEAAIELYYKLLDL